MNFGQRLADMRKARKLTQAELGRGLGTDGTDAGKQVVYGWEKGIYFPKVDQLAAICQRLGVSADWLLFGEKVAISPMAQELGAELDLVNDESARRRVFGLCKNMIRMARGASDTPEREKSLSSG